MLKAFKYRLYPTEAQKVLISKHFGCVRWVYNWALEQKIKEWSENKKNLSIYELHRRLPLMRKAPETAWLKEVSAQALGGSLTHLDAAFTAFFSKRSAFPRFKRKQDRHESFQNHQYNSVDWDSGRFFCYRFKEGIKIRLHRSFEGVIKTTTISRTPSGKYYANLVVDIPHKEPIPSTSLESQALGLDFGLKDIIVTSDGQRFENPRTLKKYMKKLKRLQQSHSRKVKGSKNREKSRLKIARLHERISNIRKDNLHKLSHHLVCKNQATTLCIEDLSVADMLERRTGSSKHLRRSIGDVGWGELRRQLEYKCKWYGKNLRTIGRFEPSSKICSSCGNVNHDLKLADREWDCVCGVHHDRDINAAINIKKMAFREQNTSSKPICRRETDKIPADSRESTLVEQPIWVAEKREGLSLHHV